MAAATAVFQSLAPGDHVLAPKVMYWSLRNWLMNFATQWGLQVELIDMTDPAAVRSRAASRQDQAGVDRNAGQPAVDHDRHRRHRGAGACRRRARGGGFDRRHAGAHAPARARRRPGDARGDQIPQRPLRPDRGRAGHEGRRRLLEAREDRARADRRHARLVRIVAVAARHAHAVPARAHGQRLGAAHRRALRAAPPRRGRALPGPARRTGPRDRGPADARRLRRHAVVRAPRAARRPRSPPRRTCSCGSAPPRSAAPRA